jgi:hypothetical protein
MTYDLLIKNGRVVDGSGGPSFQGDVAVQGGKIVGIGRFHTSATRIINAEGRVIAPGFIDHHTHYDPQALWDPLCSYSVQNGNTSVIVGMCGQVLAPARPGDHDWYLEFFAEAETIPLSAMQQGIQFTWESIAENLEALSQRRGVNVGALVGHSGVRRYVMGEAALQRANATPDELEAMKRLVREGMLAGALGFSTAPAGRRDPAGVAPDEERWALGSVLGELGTGLFQVSGGSPQGTFGSHRTARELSSQTGRPGGGGAARGHCCRHGPTRLFPLGVCGHSRRGPCARPVDEDAPDSASAWRCCRRSGDRRVDGTCHAVMICGWRLLVGSSGHFPPVGPSWRDGAEVDGQVEEIEPDKQRAHDSSEPLGPQ